MAMAFLVFDYTIDREDCVHWTYNLMPIDQAGAGHQGEDKTSAHFSYAPKSVLNEKCLSYTRYKQCVLSVGKKKQTRSVRRKAVLLCLIIFG